MAWRDSDHDLVHCDVRREHAVDDRGAAFDHDGSDVLLRQDRQDGGPGEMRAVDIDHTDLRTRRF